ncbi:hypothetical protein ACMFGU_00715 [Morganella morganii]|uniref:hypothetical protein n=1 Tax=Morganella morganii TaxID=582 RepID=UPI003CF59FC1
MNNLLKNIFSGNIDIIKNITSLLLEKLLTIVLIFYTEGLISHYLGVELYGKWIYSINIIIILSSIALIASSEVIIPALSRHFKLRWEIISAAFIIRMAFAFITYIISNVYFYFFIPDQEIKDMLMAISIMLLFTEPFGVVTNYYQSRIRIGIISCARLLSLVVRAGFISIIFLVPSYIFIYYSRAIEAIFLALFLFTIINHSGFEFKISKNVFRVIIIRGLKMWLPLILMLIYMRADRFFVEHYLGFDDLALYGVAVQIIEQAILVLGMIIQSIAPKFLFKKNTPPIYKIIIGLILISILLQLCAIILLEPFITFIFGPYYYKSIQMTISLLPALNFFVVDSILMQLIYRDLQYNLIIFKWLIMLIVSFSGYYIWFGIMDNTNVAPVFVLNYAIMMTLTYLIRKIKTKKSKPCCIA